MSLASTILKIGLAVGVVAVLGGIFLSRRAEITESISNTASGLADRFGFGDSGISESPIRSRSGFSTATELELIESNTISETDFANIESPLAPVNPTILASLPAVDKRSFRTQQETALTSLFPNVTFSTSLQGSKLAIRDQIKRDTGFNFEEFNRNNPRTEFEKVLAGEQERAEFISKSLFGNVQNPNFDLGLPSNATKADRALAIRQREEQQEIKKNIILNAQIRKEREERGEKLTEVLGSTPLRQKETLKTFGLNIIGGNTLSPVALAKLQERGLLE